MDTDCIQSVGMKSFSYVNTGNSRSVPWCRPASRMAVNNPESRSGGAQEGGELKGEVVREEVGELRMFESPVM